jgi:hypothetical protein
MLEHVAVGVAAEVISTGEGLALAAPILLPCVTRVVEVVTIELYGEPLVRPAAVDTAAAGRAVGEREWEVFVA